MGPCFSARAVTLTDELGKSWAIAQVDRFIVRDLRNKDVWGRVSFRKREQKPANFCPSQSGD
jgi:hypothetical protein